MDQTVVEILDLVRENDVKFIRLAYCDLFGQQKNMAIMSSQLERAFQEGIAFDASAVKGFRTVNCSDLFLVPDASTVSILPLLFPPPDMATERMIILTVRWTGRNTRPFMTL